MVDALFHARGTATSVTRARSNSSRNDTPTTERSSLLLLVLSVGPISSSQCDHSCFSIDADRSRALIALDPLSRRTLDATAPSTVGVAVARAHLHLDRRRTWARFRVCLESGAYVSACLRMCERAYRPEDAASILCAMSPSLTEALRPLNARSPWYSLVARRRYATPTTVERVTWRARASIRHAGCETGESLPMRLYTVSQKRYLILVDLSVDLESMSSPWEPCSPHICGLSVI